MDASWLLDRLKNPTLLEKGDERHLRELIASYPYFSAPYLLLAKSLKDQNHPAFDDLLPLISLQAFDRKRLFKLVHETENKVEFKDEVEVKVEPFDSAKSLATPPLNSSGARGQDDEFEFKAEDVEKVELPEPVDESVSRFSVNFAEIEKESEAEITEQSEIPEIPFLSKFEAQVEDKVEDKDEVKVEDKVEEKVEVEVPEPVTHDPEQTVSHLEPVERPESAEDSVFAENATENEDKDKDEVQDEVEDEVEVEIEVPEPATPEPEQIASHLEPVERPEPAEVTTPTEDATAEEEIEVPEPVTPDPEPLKAPLSTKTDFLYWLDKLAPISEEKGEFEHQEQAEQEAKTPAFAEKATSDEEVDEGPEPVTPNQTPLPKEQLAIIDKFIETNPSVSRVQEKMYNPVAQAKESERLDDTLITETMARIFVKQEKFARAIDAYQKLQLKYPQKSDYFAALIEEIKRKTS